MAVMEYTKTGIALQRPLTFDYPNDELCSDMQTQYMYGDELLVAPVLKVCLENAQWWECVEALG